MATRLQPRTDGIDVVFVERELNHVITETYDTKYPELRVRDLVPVDRSIPAGAKTFTYKQYDKVGIAKIITAYSDDLPRANVRAKEFSGRAFMLGNAYGYSYEDLLAAQFASMPLDATEAEAARRAFEELVDKIGASGDAEHGLVGFLNQPNAQTHVVPNGQSGFADWARKTAEEILADMHAIARQIVVTTKEVERPNALLLPTAQFGLVSTTYIPNSQDTVLKRFLANDPYVKSVESWNKLTGAGAGGTDRMVCYRKDPKALRLIIPLEFQQMPVQQKGLGYEIPCVGKIGGVVATYPLSICYGDGI